MLLSQTHCIATVLDWIFERLHLYLSLQTLLLSSLGL